MRPKPCVGGSRQALGKIGRGRTNDETVRIRAAIDENWSGICQVFKETVRAGDTYTIDLGISESEVQAIRLADG